MCPIFLCGPIFLRPRWGVVGYNLARRQAGRWPQTGVLEWRWALSGQRTWAWITRWVMGWKDSLAPRDTHLNRA
ncbi:MAG: hypothetical protein HC915_10100 [Anaerolineae bacterium]|nr:hypothetical protein [Anaerolineae bacterium]